MHIYRARASVGKQAVLRVPASADAVTCIGFELARAQPRPARLLGQSPVKVWHCVCISYMLLLVQPRLAGMVMKPPKS